MAYAYERERKEEDKIMLIHYFYLNANVVHIKERFLTVNKRPVTGMQPVTHLVN